MSNSPFKKVVNVFLSLHHQNLTNHEFLNSWSNGLGAKPHLFELGLTLLRLLDHETLFKMHLLPIFHPFTFP
jgi:hypothetical protein